MKQTVEELFSAWVERHVLDGTRLDPRELCGDDDARHEELCRCIAEYEALQETLDGVRPDSASGDTPRELPRFEGYRTMERIGGGGSGDVYKLEDLELGRTVAAKVLREDTALYQGMAGFLREARSLALFEDPRIVRVIEFAEGKRWLGSLARQPSTTAISCDGKSAWGHWGISVQSCWSSEGIKSPSSTETRNG